jgi:hypothetical protein
MEINGSSRVGATADLVEIDVELPANDEELIFSDLPPGTAGPPLPSTVVHTFTSSDGTNHLTLTGTLQGFDQVIFQFPNGRRVSFNGCVFTDLGFLPAVGPAPAPQCPPGTEWEMLPAWPIEVPGCGPPSMNAENFPHAEYGEAP